MQQGKSKVQLASRQWFWILLFAAKLLIFCSLTVTMEGDSQRYMDINGFGAENWLDILRTPGYPFVVECFQRIFGGAAAQALVIFQFLLSCVSVVFLYKSLRLVKLHTILCYGVTSVYGLSISVTSWDNRILTESISLSTTVIFMYLVILYVSRPSPVAMAGAAALTIPMVAIRPTSVILPVLALLFVALHALVKRPKLKQWLPSLASFLLVLGLVFGYAGAFQKRHGNFSLSNTLVVQQLATLVDDGLYQKGADEQIVTYIDTLKEEGKDGKSLSVLAIAYDVGQHFQVTRLNRFVGDIIQDNLVSYGLNRLLTLLHEASSPYGRPPQMPASFFAVPGLALNGLLYILIPPVTFGFGLQLAAISLIVWLYQWIRRKKFLFLYLGVFVFTAAFSISSILGTCNDYPRTALAALPFIFLGAGILLQQVFSWVGKTRQSFLPPNM